MRKAVWLSFVALSGCTSMPDTYTKGAREVWPWWGFRLTNETAESIDLEVIVHQYVFACTAADGGHAGAVRLQLAGARRLVKDRVW